MKPTATLAAIVLAYLITDQSERIADAVQSHPDLLIIALAGACTIAAVLTDAKGR